jgi:hypothetical protein
MREIAMKTKEKNWKAYALHLLKLADALNDSLHAIEKVTNGHGLTLCKPAPISFGLSDEEVSEAAEVEEKLRRRILY